VRVKINTYINGLRISILNMIDIKKILKGNSSRRVLERCMGSKNRGIKSNGPFEGKSQCCGREMEHEIKHQSTVNPVNDIEGYSCPKCGRNTLRVSKNK